MLPTCHTWHAWREGVAGGRQPGDRPALTMVNFGSPRVGNAAFSEAFNAAVPDAWRVYNHKDVVPRVPRLMVITWVPATHTRPWPALTCACGLSMLPCLQDLGQEGIKSGENGFCSWMAAFGQWGGHMLAGVASAMCEMPHHPLCTSASAAIQAPKLCMKSTHST